MYGGMDVVRLTIEYSSIGCTPEQRLTHSFAIFARIILIHNVIIERTNFLKPHKAMCMIGHVCIW